MQDNRVRDIRTNHQASGGLHAAQGRPTAVFAPNVAFLKWLSELILMFRMAARDAGQVASILPDSLPFWSIVRQDRSTMFSASSASTRPRPLLSLHHQRRGSADHRHLSDHSGPRALPANPTRRFARFIRKSPCLQPSLRPETMIYPPNTCLGWSTVLTRPDWRSCLRPCRAAPGLPDIGIDPR